MAARLLLLAAGMLPYAGATNAAGRTFLEANRAKTGVVTLPSGLQYEVLVRGRGSEHPLPDTTCSCHYEGRTAQQHPTGEVFDSSYARGEPTSFAPNQVIQGWSEAMQLMVAGDTWMLYVPSELAYGDAGAGDDIGPGDALVFKIELLALLGPGKALSADEVLERHSMSPRWPPAPPAPPATPHPHRPPAPPPTPSPPPIPSPPPAAPPPPPQTLRGCAGSVNAEAVMIVEAGSSVSAPSIHVKILMQHWKPAEVVLLSVADANHLTNHPEASFTAVVSPNGSFSEASGAPRGYSVVQLGEAHGEQGTSGPPGATQFAMMLGEAPLDDTASFDLNLEYHGTDLSIPQLVKLSCRSATQAERDGHPSLNLGRQPPSPPPPSHAPAPPTATPSSLLINRVRLFLTLAQGIGGGLVLLGLAILAGAQVFAARQHPNQGAHDDEDEAEDEDEDEDEDGTGKIDGRRNHERWPSRSRSNLDLDPLEDDEDSISVIAMSYQEPKTGGETVHETAAASSETKRGSRSTLDLHVHHESRSAAARSETLTETATETVAADSRCEAIDDPNAARAWAGTQAGSTGDKKWCVSVELGGLGGQLEAFPLSVAKMAASSPLVLKQAIAQACRASHALGMERTPAPWLLGSFDSMAIQYLERPSGAPRTMKAGTDFKEVLASASLRVTRRTPKEKCSGSESSTGLSAPTSW